MAGSRQKAKPALSNLQKKKKKKMQLLRLSKKILDFQAPNSLGLLLQNKRDKDAFC